MDVGNSDEASAAVAASTSAHTSRTGTSVRRRSTRRSSSDVDELRPEDIPPELRSYGYIQQPPSRPKRDRPPPGSLVESKRRRHSEEEEEEDGELYTVERIIAQRGSGGSKKYLVKWEGYSKKHNSWEPAENLDDCDAVDEFLQAQEAKAKGLDPKRTRSPSPSSASETECEMLSENGSSPDKPSSPAPRLRKTPADSVKAHPRHSPKKFPASPIRPTTTKKDVSSVYTQLLSGSLHSPHKSPLARRVLPEGTPQDSPKLPKRSQATMGLIDLNDPPTTQISARRKLIAADDDGEFGPSRSSLEPPETVSSTDVASPPLDVEVGWLVLPE